MRTSRGLKWENKSHKLKKSIVVVFSRQPLSRLIFLKVVCLQTSLSDLKMIRVFTGKINEERASANRSI